MKLKGDLDETTNWTAFIDLIETGEPGENWQVSIWSLNEGEIQMEEGGEVSPYEEETLVAFSPKRARILAAEINRLADICDQKNIVTPGGDPTETEESNERRESEESGSADDLAGEPANS